MTKKNDLFKSQFLHDMRAYMTKYKTGPSMSIVPFEHECLENYNNTKQCPNEQNQFKTVLNEF